MIPLTVVIINSTLPASGSKFATSTFPEQSSLFILSHSLEIIAQVHQDSSTFAHKTQYGRERSLLFHKFGRSILFFLFVFGLVPSLIFFSMSWCVMLDQGQQHLMIRRRD